MRINWFYIRAMCLLPVVWICDCNMAVSMLFKRLKTYSDDDPGLTFTQSLKILLILIGLCVYYVQRRWRLRLSTERAESLRRETAVTEVDELHKLRLQHMAKMQELAVEKLMSLNLITTEPLRSSSPSSCRRFRLQIENIEQERATPKTLYPN